MDTPSSSKNKLKGIAALRSKINGEVMTEVKTKLDLRTRKSAANMMDLLR